MSDPVSFSADERALLLGDLSKLSEDQRAKLYGTVCASVGLNPFTRPFDYIVLNGKLTLYAKKDATEQLRAIHNVSLKIVNREKVDDVYIVTAQAEKQDGRVDESTGATSITNLKGDALCNAIMKAETKAKRRVTLSICGLGMLDETEIETIPRNAIGQASVQVSLPPAAVTQVATPIPPKDETMIVLRNVGAKLGKLAGAVNADLAKASSPQALLESYERELEHRQPRIPAEAPKPTPVDQSQVDAIADLISAFSKSSMKHTEFDEKLVVCSSVTGREIKQYSDLTSVEAQAVIAEVRGLYGVVETESASADLVKKLQMELKDSNFVEKTLKRSKAYGNAEATGASQSDCLREARIAWAKHVLKIELTSFSDLTEDQAKTLLATASKGK
jgi:hypothetical protein